MKAPQNRLIRLVWLLTPALEPAFGQALLDPKGPDAARSIEAFEEAWKAPDSGRLEASFAFVKPVLGYNLRHYAGYDLYLPARQFDLTKPVVFASIICLESATGGQRTYLFQRQPMEPPRNLDPKTLKEAARKTSLHLGGGFYAGPGKYRYRLMMADDLGRLFRRQGSFEVKQSKQATDVAAGAIVPLNMPTWTGFAPSAQGGKLTVMVHAAPIYPRRAMTQLQPYDRYVLLTALGALLSRGGFSSAHVIVFDLAGRRVLFDEENFDRGGMRRLRRSLDQADFGTIAFQTLAQGPTPQKVAEDVLRRAAEQRDERETTAFLGPAWMPSRKQQPVNPALKEGLPKVHYLALVPRNLLPQDTITDVVRSLKGRVHPIYAPSDFVNAIEKLKPGN